jgi:curved DNA-binding protein CbpA
MKRLIGINMLRGAAMDYYQRLGVSRTASANAIRAAYRSLAQRFHPDHAGAASAQSFREIQEAYETLKMPSRRREYDSSLRSPSRAIPVTVIQSRPAASGVSPEPLAPPVAHYDPFAEFDRFFAQVSRLFDECL